MAQEIRLRRKYRAPGQSKQTGKGKAGGNSGGSTVKHDKQLPVGIRKHPRRRYGS